jgi:FlaA1/EpsC-like NDP-sugar epimerase
VKIVDLARDLITLSGFKPDDDIAVEFTGIRPGEKLFEELATDAEHADKTKHPKIFIGRIAPGHWNETVRNIEELLAVGDLNDGDRVRAALHQVVPEYSLGTKEAREPAKGRRAATGSEPVVAAS